MFSLATKKIAAILAILHLAHGFNSVDFPSEVTAGKGTTLTVVNDLGDGSNSFDAGFDSYRVYLATTPPGWGTGPVCYLVNSTAIDTTTLTLTIPADVGPSGSFYSISTMEFNQDPNMDGPSGFEYSNTFTLSGGTGEWSEAELSGEGVADPDGTPCTAYNCVRQCTNGVNLTSNDMSEIKKYYSCASNCPGVQLPSLDDTTSGADGGDSNSASGSGYYMQSSSAAPSTFGTSTSSTVATATPAPTTSVTSVSGTAAGATKTATSSSSSTMSTPSSSGSTPKTTSNAGSRLSSGLTLLISGVAGIYLM